MVIALLIIIGVAALFCLIMYNSLIGKKNQVTNIFGTIDTMLKKRYDLVPNLIATVKEYMNYEKSLLVEVTELRAKAVSGNLSDVEKVGIDNKMSQALRGIMVAVENYPALKANENFLKLQGSMNEIEEQISAARRSYNSAVTDFNNAVEMPPTSLMAGMMGLKVKPVFEIPEPERGPLDAATLFKK
jgi:LemA protein